MSNPTDIPVVGSIALLEGIPAVAGPQYGTVSVYISTALLSLYFWDETSTTTPDGFLVVKPTDGGSTGRWVLDRITTSGLGVNTDNPQAPIHVGNGNNVDSVDAQVLVSRVVDGAGVNGHAFSDSSRINRSGVIGYNSHDCRIEFVGSNDYDHYAGFQCLPIYSSTGTIQDFYSLFSGLQLGNGAPAGNVVNYYGAFINKPIVDGGSLTNAYGVYVADIGNSITGGSSWAFKSDGLNDNMWVAAHGKFGSIGVQTDDTTFGLYVHPNAGGMSGNHARLGNAYFVSSPYNSATSIGYNIKNNAGTFVRDQTDYASWITYGITGQIQTFTGVSSTAGSTITPIAGPFLVNGGTSWTNASDRTLKENISSVDVLDRLSSVKIPISNTFDLKEGPKGVTGAIAQDVQEWLPEAVSSNGEILGVDYGAVGVAAAEGVRQLLQYVKKLEIRIEELESKNAQ